MSKEVKAKSISQAIGTVIAKLCYKGADELGEKFAQHTGEWRKANAVTILQIADEKYDKIGFQGSEQAHPRLVHQIVSEGSWSDSAHVQNMWAGLLVSSCTAEGNDESNLIFVNILNGITSTQARVLNFACERASKRVTNAGWLTADQLSIQLEYLVEITGIDDFHRLDRELDHLRSLELIDSGFQEYSTTAFITPTPLALQMYVRCQGFVGSPVEFFDVDSGEDAN